MKRYEVMAWIVVSAENVHEAVERAAAIIDTCTTPEAVTIGDPHDGTAYKLEEDWE